MSSRETTTPRIWTFEECEPFDTPFRPASVKFPKPRARPDGDTFDVLINVGFDIEGVAARVRLCGESWILSGGKIGFNAWERKGDERERGDEAYRRRVELCAPGDKVLIRSFKGGSRGSLNRWLALILVNLSRNEEGVLVRTELGAEGSGWYSLADVLQHEGHGREWWRGWSQGAPRPRITFEKES